MSKRVIVRRYPLNVAGSLVKPGQECTVPDRLAVALEKKGLCEIVRPPAPVVIEAKPAPKKRVATKKKAAKKKAVKKKPAK